MGPRQAVSVAGIRFDAMIDRTEEHNATVPKYPVDEGFNVSDHVALDPLSLKMTLYVTATPVTWLSEHGSGYGRVERICGQLVSLYETRAMVNVATPAKSYDNMVIKSISIKQSVASGCAVEIPIELTKVYATSAKKTAIPAEYARSGVSMDSVGTASTTKLPDTAATSAADRQNGSAGGTTAGTARNNSTMLYNLASGVGNKTGWYSLE